MALSLNAAQEASPFYPQWMNKASQALAEKKAAIKKLWYCYQNPEKCSPEEAKQAQYWFETTPKRIIFALLIIAGIAITPHIKRYIQNQNNAPKINEPNPVLNNTNSNIVPSDKQYSSLKTDKNLNYYDDTINKPNQASNNSNIVPLDKNLKDQEPSPTKKFTKMPLNEAYKKLKRPHTKVYEISDSKTREINERKNLIEKAANESLKKQQKTIEKLNKKAQKKQKNRSSDRITTPKKRPISLNDKTPIINPQEPDDKSSTYKNLHILETYLDTDHFQHYKQDIKKIWNSFENPGIKAWAFDKISKLPNPTGQKLIRRLHFILGSDNK